MVEENPIAETPFNMAMLFYVRLNHLILEKDRLAMSGEIYGWYAGLRTIFRTIIFKIDLKSKDGMSRDDLNKLFSDVKAKLNTQLPGCVAGRMQPMLLSDAGEILDDIDCKLTHIMDKKKMIFPNIQMKGLSDLTRRFNLDGKSGKH